ncbi:hypothetical protein HDU76_009020, partial [Blyttiomyces sp. JEL0837]
MKFTSAVVLLATLASAMAAVDPSVPQVGQTNRYRALPRNSNLALVPVDGAEFVAGQRFDIGIELHSLDPTVTPDLSTLSFTINGQNPADVLKNVQAKPFITSYNATYFKDAYARDSAPSAPTKFSVTKATWRNLYLPASGDYDIVIKAGNESVKAKWVARGTSERRAKNVLLFIGDGMAPSMIGAARYLAKNTKFGKFENGDGFLHMETMGTIGKIATNGIDAIVTDSANSAAAYLSGQKGWVNGLNVYADTTGDNLDDAKVETLAEMIRRQRPGMCIGVVTTANVADATPAAVYSHTRRRSDEALIVDQMINGFNYYKFNSTANAYINDTTSAETYPWGPAVKADVLLGGGGSVFSAAGSSLFKQDYYKKFAGLGYSVAYDKASLDAAPLDAPLLGIFHSGHMDTWYDREVTTKYLSYTTKPSSPKLDGTWATSQPGLQAMTMKAINVMEKRCADGWFLMSEAASVDKSMHPMDYDRGLADLLELDRTVKAVLEHDKNKETAIFLTADHAQAFDVYGSVDINYFRSASNNDTVQADGSASTPTDSSLHIAQRQSIGVYQDAGWVDNVLDENGLPTLMEAARFRLAAGKVDAPNFYENFEHKVPNNGTNPLTRNPAINGGHPGEYKGALAKIISTFDPLDSNNGVGLPRGGNLPAGNTVSVHSLQTVDLYCAGPVAHECGKIMDNTELVFLMADALGLGDKADYTPKNPATCSTAAAPTVTVTVTYTAQAPSSTPYVATQPTQPTTYGQQSTVQQSNNVYTPAGPTTNTAATKPVNNTGNVLYNSAPVSAATSALS